MSKANYYFQFPLCVLRYDDTVFSRCSSIISYGICDAGAALWNKLPEEIREEKMDELKEMGGRAPLA
jgi:hypothetical protein